MKGFANGLSPTADSDVEVCLNTISEDTIERIKKDVEDISVLHIERSIEAIEDIGKVLLETIKACESSSESVIDLVEKLTVAFTGRVFIDAAIKIAKNPLHFISVVETIHEEWKTHNYFGSGQEMGKFVGEVIKTRQQVISIIKELL